MTKKILGLTLLLAAAGLTATAQDCCQQQQAKNECQQANGNECSKGNAGKSFNPFDGLNISAGQQARLDSIAVNCPKAKKHGRKSEGKAKACCTTDSCCKENGKAKACCATDSCCTMQNKVDPRQASAEYLAKVKEILTPEQYVGFLENLVVNSKNNGLMLYRPNGPMMRDPRTGKLVPKGKNGMRLQRPRPVPTENEQAAATATE